MDPDPQTNPQQHFGVAAAMPSSLSPSMGLTVASEDPFMSSPEPPTINNPSSLSMAPPSMTPNSLGGATLQQAPPSYQLTVPPSQAGIGRIASSSSTKPVENDEARQRFESLQQADRFLAQLSMDDGDITMSDAPSTSSISMNGAVGIDQGPLKSSNPISMRGGDNAHSSRSISMPGSVVDLKGPVHSRSSNPTSGFGSIQHPRVQSPLEPPPFIVHDRKSIKAIAEGRRIYVGNLHIDTEVSGLNSMFKGHEEGSAVLIPHGNARGAFMSYTSAKEAQAVVKSLAAERVREDFRQLAGQIVLSDFVAYVGNSDEAPMKLEAPSTKSVSPDLNDNTASNTNLEREKELKLKLEKARAQRAIADHFKPPPNAPSGPKFNSLNISPQGAAVMRGDPRATRPAEASNTNTSPRKLASMHGDPRVSRLAGASNANINPQRVALMRGGPEVLAPISPKKALEVDSTRTGSNTVPLGQDGPNCQICPGKHKTFSPQCTFKQDYYAVAIKLDQKLGMYKGPKLFKSFPELLKYDVHDRPGGPLIRWPCPKKLASDMSDEQFSLILLDVLQYPEVPPGESLPARKEVQPSSRPGVERGSGHGGIERVQRGIQNAIVRAQAHVAAEFSKRCRKCPRNLGRTFCDSQALSMHQKEKHGSDEMKAGQEQVNGFHAASWPRGQDASMNVGLRCRKCEDRTFPDNRALQLHMSIKHAGKLRCPSRDCPRTFAIDAALRQHMVSAHAHNKPIQPHWFRTPPGGGFECNFCPVSSTGSRIFNSVIDLGQHVVVQHYAETTSKVSTAPTKRKLDDSNEVEERKRAKTIVKTESRSGSSLAIPVKASVDGRDIKRAVGPSPGRLRADCYTPSSRQRSRSPIMSRDYSYGRNFGLSSPTDLSLEDEQDRQKWRRERDYAGQIGTRRVRSRGGRRGTRRATEAYENSPDRSRVRSLEVAGPYESSRDRSRRPEISAPESPRRNEPDKPREPRGTFFEDRMGGSYYNGTGISSGPSPIDNRDRHYSPASSPLPKMSRRVKEEQPASMRSSALHSAPVMPRAMSMTLPSRAATDALSVPISSKATEGRLAKDWDEENEEEGEV